MALLNARAGVPSWRAGVAGPDSLRAGIGVSAIDTLPGLYARWEVWAADVAESHTNLPAPGAVPLAPVSVVR